MPTFEYQAVNPAGNSERGTVLGSTLEQAVEDLGRRGFQVQAIQPAARHDDPLLSPPPAPKRLVEETRPREEAAEEKPAMDPLLKNRSYVATSVVGPLVGKVALKDLQFFFRQLSAMLNAGVPYAQSLNTLKTQARDVRLRKVVGEMAENVEQGRPISVAMQRYPEIFSAMMISMVRVGEEGGNLDASLKQVADYIEEEVELRNLYRRVTIYPKLLLAASVVVILATNAIIASLGKEGGLSSPLTTVATWVILGPLLVGIFLFLRVGLANPRIKHNWDRFLLLIPYLGNTLHQVAMAKFGRAFGALYRTGVPIPAAIQLAADASGNEYLRSKIYPVVGRMREGDMLGPAFRESGAFSPIVMDMVATGETTGSLDQMLGKMADYYEDESKVRAQQLGQVMGVLVLLLVACYVGYIVISFWGGYFSGLQNAME